MMRPDVTGGLQARAVKENSFFTSLSLPALAWCH